MLSSSSELTPLDMTTLSASTAADVRKLDAEESGQEVLQAVEASLAEVQSTRPAQSESSKPRALEGGGVDQCHLGAGRVGRVDRSLSSCDGPAASEEAFRSLEASDPLPPHLADTIRLEDRRRQTGQTEGSAVVVDPGSDAAAVPMSSVEDSARESGTRSVVRRLFQSMVFSAEAGGRMVDQAVGLAFGVQTSLTSETQQLLQQRLRITSLLLFFGFVAALVAETFFFTGFTRPLEQFRFWSEVVLTAMMGILSWRLCANCPHLFRHLRLVELVVFLSAGWILGINSWLVLEQAAATQHMVALSGPWQALIFTYALFIPNHWRRALWMIALMAFTPVVLALLAAIFSPVVSQFATQSIEFLHGLVSLILMSGFGTVAATWGVYTIGSLRTEVYSARQFGQYRLSRLLGVGGMGEVYVGEHLLLKRPCAIKVIKPKQASDPKMLERFEREVRSTARLTHWNTVAIYDYGRAEDGTFFYVMEYLPGLNLAQIVKLFGPLPAGRVVHLLTQICDALSEAHHQGMIHRDIKPANIFASRRGNKYDVAKLLDFGLVRRLVSRDGDQKAEGVAVGSPLFMSPEQALGQPMDHRSDIYNLGATAYFLLTGQPPFKDEDPLKVLQAHCQQTPPPFDRYGACVPLDLQAVVLRCLAKRPEDRYPDVDSLKAALSACDCRDDWSWHHAAQWWKLHRCPEKSQLDAAIEAGRLGELPPESPGEELPDRAPAPAARAASV